MPKKRKRVEILSEIEVRKCQKSCARFIRKWGYIEDKDEALGPGAPGVVIKFILWPKQLWALAAILANRLLIILKARQLGLTWLVLSYTVWRMLFFPGYTVAGVSRTEDEGKELVRRIAVILKNLPPWMIMERTPENKKKLLYYSGPVWESTTMVVAVDHPNGAKSVFHAFTSSPNSGRSFTENLVILDEWGFQQWAEEIWAGIFPTVNRPTGGQVIGLSTNKRGSFFESICHKPGDFGFTRIFLPWWTDPRRTQEWYERTKKAMPSWRQEYPATVEEAMSAGEDTAFPEFSVELHVCDDFTPPEHWRRWRSLDNGYDDPFAWYWLAVSEDGQVFIYREYTREPTEPRVTYSDQAREARKLSTYVEVDEQGREVERLEDIGLTVAGKDAWATHHRDTTGKCLIDYYREGGVTGFIPAITDRRLRKAVWHEYLNPYLDENTGRTTAKVQICRSCRKLIESLPKLIKDEKDAEKVADSAIDHWYDAAGYGLIAWHAKQTKPLGEKPKELPHPLQSNPPQKKRGYLEW